MLKKTLILMASILTLTSCFVFAEEISSTWTGNGDGLSWGDPANWNPAIVPDNNASQIFVVTIDNKSAWPIGVSLSQNRNINQLECFGEIDSLEGNTFGTFELSLLDPNGLVNHGVLVISRILIKGNVINSSPDADLEVSHGQIDGTVYNLAGATLLCGNEFDASDIQNAGLIEIPIDCTDLWGHGFYNNGRIHLFGGGCATEEVLDNDTNGVIEGFGVMETNDEGIIQNKGIIRAFTGNLMIYSNMVNTGTLQSDGGSSLHVVATVTDPNNEGTIETKLAGAVTFNRNLTNKADATIRLYGGTLSAPSITQSAGATFEGFGGITGDISIESNGLINLTGPTTIVGDVEISINSTLEISDGTTLITGHTTCNNGTIHMIGGRVICQGGLSNNGCNIIWEPGIYTNVADFNLDGQVNFKDFGDFANTWLWQAIWLH